MMVVDAYPWTFFYLLHVCPRALSLRLPVVVTPPSDQVYMQAAAVFRQLRPEKPADQQHLRYGQRPDEAVGDDETVERRAYQLAFDTLKCTLETSSALFTAVLGRHRIEREEGAGSGEK